MPFTGIPGQWITSRCKICRPLLVHRFKSSVALSRQTTLELIIRLYQDVTWRQRLALKPATLYRHHTLAEKSCCTRGRSDGTIVDYISAFRFLC